MIAVSGWALAPPPSPPSPDEPDGPSEDLGLDAPPGETPGPSDPPDPDLAGVEGSATSIVAIVVPSMTRTGIAAGPAEQEVEAGGGALGGRLEQAQVANLDLDGVIGLDLERQPVTDVGRHLGDRRRRGLLLAAAVVFLAAGHALLLELGAAVRGDRALDEGRARGPGRAGLLAGGGLGFTGRGLLLRGRRLSRGRSGFGFTRSRGERGRQRRDDQQDDEDCDETSGGHPGDCDRSGEGPRVGPGHRGWPLVQPGVQHPSSSVGLTEGRPGSHR